MDEIILSDFANVAYCTPEHRSFWFGYYNYCPENCDGTKLLAHSVNFDGRSIKNNDIAEVGWFDLKDNTWNPVGKTHAFNWQQGSMLQWLGETNRVIYNDAENGDFISRIYDLESKNSSIVSWPIYGISNDGKISISIEFKRSYWCRAYHYECISDKQWDGLLPKDDGIFSVNIDNNTVSRIISIEEIVNIDRDSSFDNAKHWLEHIMLNPSCNRFAFYHRFSYESGFVTRVFTANTDGSDLRIINGWRDFSWSHMGWINDNEFYIYGVKKNSAVQAYRKLTEQHGGFGRALRKIYKATLSKLITKQVRKKTNTIGTYQICSSVNGTIIDEIPLGLFPLDGHPSFTRDGRYMLTDTYEDEYSYRHLYIYDVKNKKKIEVARLFSAFNSCDYRSDLHPRFSFDEKRIIVDSAHSGYHRIVGINIDWNIIASEISK